MRTILTMLAFSHLIFPPNYKPPPHRRKPTVPLYVPLKISAVRTRRPLVAAMHHRTIHSLRARRPLAAPLETRMLRLGRATP
ncbi:hypothetical protein PYCCODRAFT_341824 [Trametes coccinea BRFM310]|uniref:Uncharacterized protein n=1 Tax=Trametes coccinea (strain BRFM310) TaxID=1353009 RepID=A0A1Y2J2Y2_TRAC3|nr:hypothetical protein PYCCODRAFT_341824 [Trametes coccinea BRFM310]